jgi:hypothetical protein
MPTVVLAQSSTSDNPSYNFHFEYTGPNSYWVHLLLLRNSSWSCPTAQGSATSAQGFNDKANNRCIRDQYVWGAVVSAWHAECGSRFAKNKEDQQLVEASAGLVVFSLGEAAKLCSNNPTIGTEGVDNSCATDKLVSCAEILSLATPSQPFTVTTPQIPTVERTQPSQQQTPDSQSTTPPNDADNGSQNDTQNENDTQSQDDTQSQNDTQNEVMSPTPNLIQQTADKWQQQLNNMASQKAAKGNGSGNSGSSSGTCGCGQPCNKPGAHPAC